VNKQFAGKLSEEKVKVRVCLCLQSSRQLDGPATILLVLTAFTVNRFLDLGSEPNKFAQCLLDNFVNKQ
jgi:hypothetical protein